MRSDLPRTGFAKRRNNVRIGAWFFRPAASILLAPGALATRLHDLFGGLGMFGKANSVEGMRLGGQMIGDRFLEDAYLYRIS
jgi:hypothetical protein